MTDIKKHEPLWGAWYVESLIGGGSFGKVYKVKKEEFGKTYWSAVKVISVTPSKEDLSRARSEGLDEASVRSLSHASVMDIIQEVDLMYEFRGNSNIVSFEEHKVIEHEGEIGWDILIRMELLNSLSEYAMEKPLSPDEIVKLGIHICRALELCSLKKIIHRDIKPENIFVSQYGEYKLGDFGIARKIENSLSFSVKGTESYMAPEVYKGEEYGASVDTYSLGIVMYRYLNRNRLPFESEFPSIITHDKREEARKRRMRGEPLPPVDSVDPAILAVVLKACSYKRGERFAGAADMREALEKISGGKNYSPVVTEVPPPIPRFPRNSSEPAYEATEGVYSKRVIPESEKKDKRDLKDSLVSVPPGIIKKLALIGAVCFALLGMMSVSGGIGDTMFIFLPLYCFFTAQCFIDFRNKYVNVLFISVLLLYLAYSFLFVFRLFDYHTLILTWSVLALYAAGSPGKSRSALYCSALAVCSVAVFFLVSRALPGISTGSYHDYVVGGVAVPFLMLFISVMGLLMLTNRTFYAAAALFSVQFFPLIALVLYTLNDSFRYISGAGFVRMALGGFSLPYGLLFCAAIVQSVAFVSFFALASARLVPDLFIHISSANNRKKFMSAIIILIVIFIFAMIAVSAFAQRYGKLP